MIPHRFALAEITRRSGNVGAQPPAFGFELEIDRKDVGKLPSERIVGIFGLVNVVTGE